MDPVYVLQHAYQSSKGEHIKMIGVYSSEQLAKDAINRLVKLPGFSKYPDGFHIDAYPLNRDHWSEGFG
jgi:homoserine kinase type II